MSIMSTEETWVKIMSMGETLMPTRTDTDSPASLTLLFWRETLIKATHMIILVMLDITTEFPLKGIVQVLETLMTEMPTTVITNKLLSKAMFNPT